MTHPARERAWVIAFRVATLLVAALALTAAFGVALRRHAASGLTGGPRYVCPMHPEVTSFARGECPICRMDLEPMGGDEGAVAGSIHASTFQVYDDARRRGFGIHARAPAWVEGDGLICALFYEDEIGSLARDRASSFFLAQAPTSPMEVVPLTEPSVPWDAATSRLRFRVIGKQAALPLSAVGWVKAAGTRQAQLTIPYSAVLEDADGAYVLVASSDGQTLTKRSIDIGRVLGGVAIVLAGLGDRERVLTRSVFLVDAERRLRRATTVELTP